jgi:hypothetical protein
MPATQPIGRKIMTATIPSAYAVELAALEAKYAAALNFIESLSVQPVNPRLVAADYALNGSFMRSYDVDGGNLVQAINNVADSIVARS